MAYSFTPDGVRDCIVNNLASGCQLFFNELELQMFVARTLEREFNANSKSIQSNRFHVYLEYRLPLGWNTDFDTEYSQWAMIPYFDVVLEDTITTEFIIIELKYKLREITFSAQNSNCLKRFGTVSANQKISLVSSQGTGNEARYDFWKDVKRLELLTKYFSNVKGGVSLFYTNERSYMNCNAGHKYSNFNLTPAKGGFLYWDYDNKRICAKGCKCGSSVCMRTPCGERLKRKTNNGNNWGSYWVHYERPNFTLNGKYTGKWHNTNNNIYLNSCMGQKFYCYSVLVTRLQTARIGGTEL